MLITCPECTHQVSDKAISCPNCGYPMLKPPNTRKAVKKQYNKRQRLPNGFGRITEIKSKRLRKPFRVMVSDGKDEFGKPIGRLLKPEAYFATYNEAYAALMKYHENPYDFSNDIAMAELYERWFKNISERVGKSRIRQVKAVWNYCDSIKDIKVQELRIRDIKNLLDNGFKYNAKGEKVKPTENTKSYVRVAISQMLDYAVEYEIIKHNFMRDVNLASKEEIETNPHISFTDEEMSIIKSHAKDNECFMLILVNCYMGWRPNEILSLRTLDVNIKEGYIKGGSKTKAGKDRIVPIHSGIMPYIGMKYNEAFLKGRDTLFSYGDYTESYKVYRRQFVMLMKEYNLNPNHRPHDCRKQFITMAKNKGVDEFAIKRIVGHAIKDLTEKVYTDRSLSWLKTEIEKIPF